RETYPEAGGARRQARQVQGRQQRLRLNRQTSGIRNRKAPSPIPCSYCVPRLSSTRWAKIPVAEAGIPILASPVILRDYQGCCSRRKMRRTTSEAARTNRNNDAPSNQLLAGLRVAPACCKVAASSSSTAGRIV